jgi:hypothetical protein
MKIRKNTTHSEQFQIPTRGTVDTPNTYIHVRSLPWFGTDTSIKSGGIELEYAKSIVFTILCV